MSIDSQMLPWHEPYWQHLAAYLQQKRIPQALIINGPPGLGKHLLVNQFASSLLCNQPLANGIHCGQCSPCLLVKAQTHPDLLYLKPDEPGKAIAIGQIRELIPTLSLKPQYQGYRVLIINPADSMNRAAANAFLKFLEEPTERTIILLITERLSQLPATIASRCQKMTLSKPEPEAARLWLTSQGIDQNKSALLLSLALGSPLLARVYAEDGTIEQRENCLTQWLKIGKHQLLPTVVAEEWSKLPTGKLQFWMTSWVIDWIKCCFGLPVSALINPDLKVHWQEFKQPLELNQLYSLYDLLLLSRERFEKQLNNQLLLEEILINWSHITRSP
ncbi:DNA polymerase III subunit delta' [Methylicorpusculum sp.]|uniref:DNA polymerase III subunit delta' n=2 Tax=Methylicorpusculum sp. TaxID=2713644 RepID=UPI0027298258|nr:DNA polymerase III subunit delta' [Methylicorpusculum sp.]